jgi:hypothetical protein
MATFLVALAVTSSVEDDVEEVGVPQLFGRGLLQECLETLAAVEECFVSIQGWTHPADLLIDVVLLARSRAVKRTNPPWMEQLRSRHDRWSPPPVSLVSAPATGWAMLARSVACFVAAVLVLALLDAEAASSPLLEQTSGPVVQQVPCMTPTGSSARVIAKWTGASQTVTPVIEVPPGPWEIAWLVIPRAPGGSIAVTVSNVAGQALTNFTSGPLKEKHLGVVCVRAHSPITVSLTVTSTDAFWGVWAQRRESIPQ